MKITVTKTETIEKATPFFTKEGDKYYAFYEDTSRMTVYDFKENPLISVSSDLLSASYPEITAKEFEDTYVRVSERLNDLFEQGRDIVRDSKSIDTLINELNKD